MLCPFCNEVCAVGWGWAVDRVRPTCGAEACRAAWRRTVAAERQRRRREHAAASGVLCVRCAGRARRRGSTRCWRCLRDARVQNARHRLRAGERRRLAVLAVDLAGERLAGRRAGVVRTEPSLSWAVRVRDEIET